LKPEIRVGKANVGLKVDNQMKVLITHN